MTRWERGQTINTIRPVGFSSWQCVVDNRGESSPGGPQDIAVSRVLRYNEKMSLPRQRKPRFQRFTPAPAVRLTDRDFTILDLISRHRFLRSDHLTALVAGSSQHIVRRLGRLFHAGLLARPHQQLRLADQTGPLVYCLSERGRRVLKAQDRSVYPSIPRSRKLASALRLGHDLRVADVVVALDAFSRRVGKKLRLHHEWKKPDSQADALPLSPLGWSVRVEHNGDRQRHRVIPDAGFSIGEGDADHAYCILEVDRGTMPVTRSDPNQTSFQRKVLAYRETRSAGVLWKRWDVPGFRVLVVTETRKRMESLQRATAECFRYGRSTMFLFAVASELLAEPNPLEGPWQNCMGEPAVLVAQPATETTPRQSLPSPAA